MATSKRHVLQKSNPLRFQILPEQLKQAILMQATCVATSEVHTVVFHDEVSARLMKNAKCYENA